MIDCTNLRRFYVYVLVDSGTGSAFYVGKGSGKRVFSHLKQWRKGICTNAQKTERITQIFKVGNAVLERCLVDDLSEHDAYEFERQVIEFIGISNLTNIKDGAGRLCKPRINSVKRHDLFAMERSEAAARLNITSETILAEFDEAIEMARRNGQLAAMNKAIAAKSHILTI